LKFQIFKIVRINEQNNGVDERYTFVFPRELVFEGEEPKAP
jgi:hypothetical protein